MKRPAVVLLAMLAGCEGPPDGGRAEIDLSAASAGAVVLDRVTAAYDAAGQALTITWRARSADSPFLALRGPWLEEGVGLDRFDVAFQLPGFDDPVARPLDELHPCAACTGVVAATLDEAMRYLSVNIDGALQLRALDGCVGYCEHGAFGFVMIDGGAVYVPPSPCDGGACLDPVPCPDASTAPIPATCDVDLGQCQSDAPGPPLCANPGLILLDAPLKAAAVLREDDLR